MGALACDSDGFVSEMARSRMANVADHTEERSR